MAYTKAHALTAGTNAEAEKLAENYEDARRYINRDIVAADLAVDSVDFPEIVRGEYSDITGLHQFTFGFGWGLFLDRQLRNVNPISNKSKNEALGVLDNQNGTGPPAADVTHVVTMWQTVPDSGIQIELERAALVTYRAWTEVVIAENLCEATAIDMNVIPQHRYTTFTALRDPTVAATDDVVPLATSTLGRHYDETEYASGGSAPSSWGGPTAQDPYYDTTSSDGYKDNIYPYYYRRMYCITKTWELSAGLHNFGLLVDAHHHNGVFWTTNCTVEVEYV